MLFSSCYVAALLSSFTINHPLCGVSGGNGADCGVTQVSGTQAAEKQKSHPGTSSWFCLCSPYFSTNFDSLSSVAPFLLHIHRPLQFFSALFKLHSPTSNHPITPPPYIYLSLFFPLLPSISPVWLTLTATLFHTGLCYLASFI